MLLKIKPNVILLLGYFEDRSIPSLVCGAIASSAVLAQEGALLGVVGGRVDSAGERRGPGIIPDRFIVLCGTSGGFGFYHLSPHPKPALSAWW